MIKCIITDISSTIMWRFEWWTLTINANWVKGMYDDRGNGTRASWWVLNHLNCIHSLILPFHSTHKFITKSNLNSIFISIIYSNPFQSCIPTHLFQSPFHHSMMEEDGFQKDYNIIVIHYRTFVIVIIIHSSPCKLFLYFILSLNAVPNTFRLWATVPQGSPPLHSNNTAMCATSEWRNKQVHQEHQNDPPTRSYNSILINSTCTQVLQLQCRSRSRKRMCWWSSDVLVKYSMQLNHTQHSLLNSNITCVL